LGRAGLRWARVGGVSFSFDLLDFGDRGFFAAGEPDGFEWDAAADAPVVRGLCVGLALLVLAVESFEVGAGLAECAELGFLGMAKDS
jgi:hypothetical protein